MLPKTCSNCGVPQSEREENRYNHGCYSLEAHCHWKPKEARAEYINQLVANFTDLVNQYGTEAKEVEAVKKEHAGDPELVKLMESIIRTKTLFDEKLID